MLYGLKERDRVCFNLAMQISFHGQHQEHPPCKAQDHVLGSEPQRFWPVIRVDVGV